MVYKKGLYNDITDVPEVLVGQVTIENEENHTGVSVVIPCEGNIYDRRPTAAVYVENGYGKTVGSIQVEELGYIETPIALTNTLCTGRVSDALITYTLERGTSLPDPITSVNPIVGETNDGKINTIQNRAVEEHHVLEAIEKAGKVVQQGSVGAGTGTVCYGLKGGIGSASRVFSFQNHKYTIGVLVQTNHGILEDLMIDGQPVGKEIAEGLRPIKKPEKGSIMIVLATDLPLSSRQLKRVLKRSSVGLVRTGSYLGHGSGDIYIGFTNGICRERNSDEKLQMVPMFPEDSLDVAFRAAADAVEEAILNSMFAAESRTAPDGTVYYSLSSFMDRQ